MSVYDTVITGGCLISPVGELHQDLGISDGKIAAIEPNLAGQGKEEIAAEGAIITPGIIDSHVHINEPGNTDWEGFETGSRAAIAGGITCIFDMPLNSLPTTINVEALELKKQRAETKCMTDFAFWGGLVPGNLGELEALHHAGVIGYKAFMSNSGLDEFPHADKTVLKKGMKIISKLPGMRLALHAEDNELTKELSRQAILSEQTSAQDFLNSRPIEAELIAIQSAIDISAETNCPIHIVHVSCPEGIDLITKAKQTGIDITVETCPHYLYFTSDVLETVGSLAKCAPPLRRTGTVLALREKLRTREIDTIGSDHSPCPATMKKGNNFFQPWGGISGLQHSGPIIYSLLRETLNMDLCDITKLMSQAPAQRFGLRNKGAIVLGGDADLCIGNLKNTQAITNEELHYRNPHSPYVGTTHAFNVETTIVRGNVVYKNKEFQGHFQGKFIRPNQ